MSDPHPVKTPERVRLFNNLIRPTWKPDLTFFQAQQVARGVVNTLWRMGFSGDHDDQTELGMVVGVLVGLPKDMEEFENLFWEVAQEYIVEMI